MFLNYSTRRTFLKTAAAASVVSSAGAQTAQPRGVPNIVYLHSHDSGRYLRPYGHNVPTPNLMRIAARGVLFRKMHCAAPSCSASRAALLTGQSPHAAGMNGLAHLGWRLNDYNQHLLHTLRREKGYYTVLAGLQHIATDPKMIGFDEILPGTHRLAQDVADHTVEFLKRTPKQPFFLDCGFFETHREFPKPTDNADYIQPPAQLPDDPATRLDMAGFHQSARDMDRAVGRILDSLEANGLLENTLILSTTDHGIAFPRMKANLTDGGLGVSCIMSGPGVFSKAGVCDALLSQVDIFPTLCEYLGIAKPSWLAGKSFLPLLRGEVSEVNKEIFAEVTYHAAYEPIRCVRTDRFKYIRRFDGRHHSVLPNCDDGLSKSLWLKDGWKAEEIVAPEELYDLVFDANERNNLANASSHQVTLNELRATLAEWMKITNDPLLKGPVSLPPNGKAAPADGISPHEIPGVKSIVF
jgi:arylsulfatase A-like enzyme